MDRETVEELHYRDLAFLDRLHVVACLLHPFHDAAKGTAAFWAVGDDGPRSPVLDDGFRFLERIVAAIDEAIEGRDGLREYPLDVMAVLVPTRWTVHSLSRAWHVRGHPDEVDHPLPDDPGEILDFAFMAVQRAAREFHNQALYWHHKQTKEPEVAHA
ncbi:MAG TPA: hypothetical protein VMN39_07630 [Longimicrobiaceae bacterium]|nr:hypothetical protein [Longimicrobiaceae bacterium]